MEPIKSRMEMEKILGETKLVKYLQNLHLDGEKAVKDVYHNFNSVVEIFQLTVAYLENLEEKPNRSGSLPQFLRKHKMEHNYKGNSVHLQSHQLSNTKGYMEHKFLITFFMSMMRRCISEDGMVNESLVNILTYIECHMVDAAQILLRLKDFKKYTGMLESTQHKDMVSRMEEAYSVILTAAPTPSKLAISELLMFQHLDHVLENLNWLEITGQKEFKIESLKKKLAFLKEYLQFIKDWINNGERWQEVMVCVQSVVDKVAYYCFLIFFHPDKDLFKQIDTRVDSEVRIGILKALVLKSDSSPPLTNALLMDYVDCVQQSLTGIAKDQTIDLSGPMKDQFEFLHEGLRFLMHLLMNSENYAKRENISGIILRLQNLARNIGSFILSYITNEIDSLLSDLLEEVSLIKSLFVDAIFPTFVTSLRQTSPKTYQPSLMNFILEDMKELLDTKGDLFMEWKDQLQIINEALIYFKSFLQDIGESGDLYKRIISAACEAQYFLHLLVAEACPSWWSYIWISDLIKHLQSIKDTVSSQRDGASKNASVLSSPALVPTTYVSMPPLRTNVFVGFEDEKREIINQLTSGLRDLNFVSIVGMGGMGKTTIAQIVFEHPLIVSYFDVRSWCNVSQNYRMKNLALSILETLIELTPNLHAMDVNELLITLHKQLMGRRYLIVLDDVWDMVALKDLIRFLPRNSNGSQIMFTSRLLDLQVESDSKPITLRLFNDYQGWDLFEKTVFGEESCPPQLRQLGIEIVKRCGGLPLAIVVVAGVVSKSDLNPDTWRRILESLSSGFPNSDGGVMGVLELSYKSLPHLLKPLFLFLGAFPEDEEIPVDKLIWLWISEGLVQNTEASSLEAEAETNLVNLIDRNLVMIAQRKSNGSLKACLLHDLIRDLCLKKAEEDCFLHHINLYNELPGPIIYQRRLSISLDRKEDAAPPRPLIANENLPMLTIPLPLHSLFMFKRKKSLPFWKEETYSVFQIFKLLRVLHFESTSVGDNLSDDLIMLVHLRYVSIRVAWNSIPSSISNLQNLETLIIKGIRGEIAVPNSIWKMAKLRHIHIHDRACFDFESENPSRLENLKTLSSPVICYGEEMKLIKRTPNLLKLRCLFVEARNSSQNCWKLPQLEYLWQLESLKLLCHSRVQWSGGLNLPLSLKNLTLSKFNLQWNDISGLEYLPNLEVLKLQFGTVEGDVWNMDEVCFLRLKLLKLESLNIKQWHASDENFPELEKLVVERCKQLEEIPLDMGYCYALQKIEVLWCSRSVAISAFNIMQEQQEMGNESFAVRVHPQVREEE